MCGIFSFLSSSSIDPKLYSQLFNAALTVRPRGPEYTNSILTDYSYTAFHRLAINGLSMNKSQPYHYSNFNKLGKVDETGIWTLMCNGEIYTAPELCQKYLKEEFPNGFQSGMSDVEVIFPLFKKFNFDFRRLNLALEGCEYALLMYYTDSKGVVKKCFASTDYLSIRPLFYYFNSDDNHFICSSTLEGLTSLKDIIDLTEIKRLPGGHIVEIEFPTNLNSSEEHSNFSSFSLIDYKPEIQRLQLDIGSIQEKIVETLSSSVKDRLLSDRPIAALLSGGLDSSLTASLVAKFIYPQKLNTFSIGLSKDSPDCKYARMVAAHIGSNHHEIIVSEQEALSVIPEVIRVIGSYDITTVRASVWQYLLCKYISENTDYKVVVAGECSDEMLGYVYFRMAPDAESFQKETEKLLREIHLYDGLRADRCISHFGLEGRFPFSDSRFVQLVLSIDPKWKMHSEERMEKAILRQSFAELMPTLLPSEVLWRRKVAMSDGTSLLKRSWSDIVKEYIHNIQCNSSTAIKLKTDVIQCPSISEESEYYRAVWQSYYDEKASHILEHFWLPNQEWFAESVMDPSARTLKIYKDVEK